MNQCVMNVWADDHQTVQAKSVRVTQKISGRVNTIESVDRSVEAWTHVTIKYQSTIDV